MISTTKILEVTQGRLVEGPADEKTHGISIDSRTIRKGDIFVAVKGHQCDGHNFIGDAIKRGASALLISKKIRLQAPLPTIKVKDTTVALGKMASWYRDQFTIAVIAITGSTGKTTTKEMIASVLQGKYKVLKNAKSENNQFGVPLTIFKLNKSHQILILELGTNQRGDISWLGKMAKPTVAVFTNIGASHLQGLKSISGVFREKMHLMRYLASNGCVIFNGDDKCLRSLAKRGAPSVRMMYSIDRKSVYQATNIDILDQDIRFKVRGKKYTLKTPVQHNIYNALVAICCGSLFKVSYNKTSICINRKMLFEGRQNIKKIGRLRIIDDSYNANPISFKSALETLNVLGRGKRKILVCGDMLELGSQSQKYHQGIGESAAKSGIDLLLTIGKQTRSTSRRFKSINGKNPAFHASHINEINRRLKKYCQAGDVVLVKGSRSMRMERVVQFLEKNFK